MLLIPPTMAVIFNGHRQTSVTKIIYERERNDDMLADSPGILTL
jgi:hypothetical protein